MQDERFDAFFDAQMHLVHEVDSRAHASFMKVIEELEGAVTAVQQDIEHYEVVGRRGWSGSPVYHTSVHAVPSIRRLMNHLRPPRATSLPSSRRCWMLSRRM